MLVTANHDEATICFLSALNLRIVTDSAQMGVAQDWKTTKKGAWRWEAVAFSETTEAVCRISEAAITAEEISSYLMFAGPAWASGELSLIRQPESR